MPSTATSCRLRTADCRPTGTGIASADGMAITDHQNRLFAVTAVGAGVVLAARMWRRRDPYEFAGKSVLITGGARGPRLVMARQPAEESAKLTPLPPDEKELSRAIHDIHAHPPFAGNLAAPAPIPP